jgi:hypothetical protein
MSKELIVFINYHYLQVFCLSGIIIYEEVWNLFTIY